MSRNVQIFEFPKQITLERIILLNICTILHILYILTSPVKRLIVINRIQKIIYVLCIFIM